MTASLSDRTFTLAEDPRPAGRGPWERPSYDRSAPLPLNIEDGIRRAIQLRRGSKGRSPQFGWGDIAFVMGEYHGLWYSDGWWSRKCKEVDPNLRSPRGVMWMGSERVHARPA